MLGAKFLMLQLLQHLGQIAGDGAEGFGIRLDEGSVYNGVRISPFFDSLLVKVTAHSSNVEDTVRKLKRALLEFRIRGVKTNIRFLLNIINHPEFIAGRATVNDSRAKRNGRIAAMREETRSGPS